MLLGGGVWTGCTARKAAAPEVAAAGPYVGAQACAECHAEIFRSQSATSHARSLRPARAAEFADPQAVRVRDPQTGLEYGFRTRGETVEQVRYRDGRKEGAVPVEFLLGSGHHGISPMSRTEGGWRYLPLTYYAHQGWDLSPMHGLGSVALSGKNADGWPVSSAELQKCWSCHSTHLEYSGSELAPERSELGIRCESCHGPGRAHVEAARKKAPDLAIQNARRWPTESFMALCQQCHNETATVEGTLMGISSDPADPGTVKYHVYGLEQSRCFRESRGAMRCTTCHDPHRNAETSAAYYEERCRGCHQPVAPAKTACKAGQTAKCLSCHMPKVQVEKFTTFADHWIRARSPFVKTLRR